MNLRLALLAALLTLVFATSAQAVHWPNFGGEAGRSGYQPVDEGGVPVAFSYSKINAEDQDIRTSIITSAGGGPSTQRTIYGTTDGSAGSGSVHHQVLGTGAAVGAEAGVDVNDGTGTDAFGSGDGSVSPVDTSSATALGMTFQVHNDDNQEAGTDDIAIAKIDQSTGALLQDDPLTLTDGFAIQSSPVVTAGATATDRRIFFVAANGTDSRLYKVDVTNATSTTASAFTTNRTADLNATVLSSPTIANLTPPGPGAVEPYVLFGTFDVAAAPTVQACSAAALTCDLSSAGIGNVTETINTPSVPVTDAGQPPTTAPHVFVARSNTVLGSSVDRLVQATPGAVLTRPAGAANTVSLGLLATSGIAAPALALDQEVVGGAVEAGGRVIVTTSTNLFSADADDLGGGTLANNGASVGPLGFGRTTALISGNFGYVTRNNGTQVVFNVGDALSVSAANFTQNAGNAGATAGFGQPSLSRGFVQFASDNGLFVYRNADLIDPTVALEAPENGVVVSGPLAVSARAFDARGIQSVTFRVNGVNFATVGTATGGTFAAPGGLFEVTGSTAGAPNGTYTLDAVALDGGGRFKASAPRTITINNPIPAGPPGANPILDKKKPSCANRVAKRRLRTALRSGLSVRVRCDEAGKGNVQILSRGSKKSVTFARAGTKTVRVRFNAKAKRALRRKRAVVVRVRTTLTDAAGNKGTRTTRVTLRR